MKQGSRIGAVLLLAVVAGCASTSGEPEVEQRRASLLDPKPLEYERELLTGGRAPTIALALSGGGTKAAVFSHGVLHGLNDANVLDSVEVLSTTSGGGYAAYWLMSKRMDALDHPTLFGKDGYRAIFKDCFPAWFGHATLDSQKKMRAEAITQAWTAGMEVCDNPVHYSRRDGSDPYRWQAHLLRWPDVFKPGYTPIIPWLPDNVPVYTEVNGVVATVMESLLSRVTTADPYVPTAYQFGIERAWGLDPKPRKAPVLDLRSEWHFANDTDAESEPLTRPLLHVAAETMTWERLRKTYVNAPANQRLPLWVLNTNEGQKGRQPNDLNLFEITPFGYGSPRWGYIYSGGPDQQLKTIARGVRASAAFADAQGLANPYLAKGLDDIAQNVRAAEWGVPFVHPEDPKRSVLRLSDGGGSDNLALVSAVRRGVTDVIVADTAQDPRGTMADLCWSLAMLKELHFTAKFRALENLEQVCSDVQDRALPGDMRIYDVDAWLNPVVHGTLTNNITQQTTHVWLIKAAWNEQKARAAFDDARCGFQVDDFNCLLAMFLGTRFTSPGAAAVVDAFPQHGTATQTVNGSPSLILAYRELGRMAARQLTVRNGRIALLHPRQCIQRVMARQRLAQECFDDD